ncbi:hypothetical protein AtubIFM54640_010330 [Aspergillus tubingensis]|nr:hypothetical protein AtubIFM54640_010330 [Aspergillus tubingensis]
MSGIQPEIPHLIVTPTAQASGVAEDERDRASHYVVPRVCSADEEAREKHCGEGEEDSDGHEERRGRILLFRALTAQSFSFRRCRLVISRAEDAVDALGIDGMDWSVATVGVTSPVFPTSAAVSATELGIQTSVSALAED